MIKKNQETSPYSCMMWLMFLSFILKGIGFVNRMVIAYYFGTNARTDIYYIASGFIDSVSSIILAGSSVGVISLYIQEKKEKRSDKFLTHVLVFVEFLMFALVLLCLLFSPTVAAFLAPKVSIEEKQWLINILRLLSITFPFIGIGSVMSSALQAEGKFTPVKLMGSITSIVSIVCVIALSGRVKEEALPYSYIISNVMNAIFVLICMKKMYHFSFQDMFFPLKELNRLIKLSVPLLIALAAHEVNLIIDKSLATAIEVGAASALSYSSVLYLFLENIVINSVVTVTFPDLKKKISDGREVDIAINTRNTIYYTELLLIPLVVVTFCCSTELVSLLFQRGQFGTNSLKLTSLALKGYVIGLPFLAIRDIVTRVYYAYNDTKYPMIVNIISVAINIVLDFVLGLTIGIIGITLATTISLLFSSVAMYWGVETKNADIKNVNIRLITSYLVAVVIMSVIGIIISQLVPGRLLCLTVTTIICFLAEMCFVFFKDRRLIFVGFEFIKKNIKRGV